MLTFEFLNIDIGANILNLVKNIYIIRHGQTDYNLKGIVQGSGVNSSLNNLGIKQALSFHKAYSHIAFDKIYTSNLNRTIESVKNFIDNGHSIEKLEGLNEINWGIVEGKEPDIHTSALFLETMQKWKDGDYHIAVEDGETPFQMQKRQMLALEYIFAQEKEETILIASHGRAMRSLLCTMLNLPLSAMDDFPHTNLCLYKLIQTNGSIELVMENNTEHLIGL